MTVDLPELRQEFPLVRCRAFPGQRRGRFEDRAVELRNPEFSREFLRGFIATPVGGDPAEAGSLLGDGGVDYDVLQFREEGGRLHGFRGELLS